MSIVMRVFISLAIGSCFAVVACDDDGSEAMQHGVGAACSGPADCTVPGLTCLPFKRGYCGLADCTKNQDCPAGSACVTHTDSRNYCFLVCVDKPDCNCVDPPACINRFRPVEAEANCVSSVTFVESGAGKKACEPPSG